MIIKPKPSETETPPTLIILENSPCKSGKAPRGKMGWAKKTKVSYKNNDDSNICNKKVNTKFSLKIKH